MKTIGYLLISIFLVAAACKKGKADFTIKGVLTDATFNQSMAGISVSLYEIEAGTTTQSLIGTVSTGSDGSYSFTFPRNQAEAYLLKAEKNNYFPINETINFSDLTIENDNIRNFSTTAKAWMKLRFTNQAPANTWDVLRYSLQEGKTGCDECLGSGTYTLYGIVDTVFYCVTDGNSAFTYYYEVDGTPDSGFKSTTSVAFDTVSMTLNY